jgi:F0F1-type ATP synthase membrane subunit b/b'
MQKDAERLVEQERKQVHLDLVNETVELAVHEAAQLLAKSVTADDHARLANDLLAELSRRPASRAARPGGAA